MVEHIDVHIVSPERKVASLTARQVLIPGVEGDLTVLPNHSTFLTVLRPGILAVYGSDETHEFVVTGGFVDVSGENTTILAEKAVLKSEIGNNFVEQLILEIEKQYESTDLDRRSAIGLRLNDLRLLNELI